MLDPGRVKEIAESLESAAPVDTGSFLEKYHPAEIAAAIDQIHDDDKILKAFHKLGVDIGSEVLAHLDDHARTLILEKLPTEKLGDMIEEMDSDDAADVLTDVSEERAEDILHEVSDEVEQEVSRLMEFEEDTAGHLMQTELVSVPEDYTVAETIDKIRVMSEEVGDLHNIFVVDERNRLRGTLSLRKLIISQPSARMKDLMDDQPLMYVTADADQEHVAALFKKYDLVSLPVVDKDMTLLGRIVVDDIVDVLEEEADEDLMMMVGAHDEALVQTHSAVAMARYRLPWLGSSLLGGFITGALIWQFKMTISEALALTAFIPVVMGISGNVGAQSSALVVRGVATGRIGRGALRRYFIKELKVGLFLGVTCGIVAGIAAYLWQGAPVYGLVVGLSIFFSIELAALMGSAIPLFFKWANIDPAIAGGPIVLALNDISGLFIFFAIATLLITYLR